MLRVVGVHGVANLRTHVSVAQAIDDLSSIWSAALSRSVGATQLDVRVAYFADILNEPLPQGAMFQPPQHLHGPIRSWAKELGIAMSDAQGPATAPIRQILQWVVSRYGLDNRITEWFVRQFFTEVDIYFRDQKLRQCVRQRLTDLMEEHRPTVVIAHSLGSVVAYEALCSNANEIDLLITLGSPLGMPDIIFDRLESSDGSMLRPPGVRRWINIADIGDLIAIPRALGHRFEVDADYETNIGLFDFHRVTKYLATNLVGLILATLTHDSQEE